MDASRPTPAPALARARDRVLLLRLCETIPRFPRLPLRLHRKQPARVPLPELVRSLGRVSLGKGCVREGYGAEEIE